MDTEFCRGQSAPGLLAHASVPEQIGLYVPVDWVVERSELPVSALPETLVPAQVEKLDKQQSRRDQA